MVKIKGFRWFAVVLMSFVTQGALSANKGSEELPASSEGVLVSDDQTTSRPRLDLRLENLSVSVRQDHPRLHITSSSLEGYKAKTGSEAGRWRRLKHQAKKKGSDMLTKALVGMISGHSGHCRKAIKQALDVARSKQAMRARVSPPALVYDWCYSALEAEEKQKLISYFNRWGDHKLANPGYADVPGYGNYWPRNGYDFAAIGLATYGDNRRAKEWMSEYRIRRFEHVDLDLLNKIRKGGGWPEGPVYDWIGNLARVKAMDAWESATGENLFNRSTWFRQRLGYLLMQKLPGVSKEWGYQFHPYVSLGDAERERGTMVAYARVMGLILATRFPDDPLAQQLMGYLSEGPTAKSASFLLPDEFIWFNSEVARANPVITTHFAAGTGTVFMRSGWPDGAADRDKSPTWISFQAGDHFSYHQHYDQNSFTLYKYSNLLLDSGVYSGNGLSDHDVNYYVRSIAHNTLVVYNPAENMKHARPDATANDGGQRTVFPASRAPTTAKYFDQNFRYYDTADILRFEDSVDYSYLLGDATQAYNSPRYNQAENTRLTGNIAKVSRFLRGFVYLRSPDGDDDFVVILDRVGVTRPEFSGQNTKLLFQLFSEPEISGEGEVLSPGETLYRNPGDLSAVNGEGKLFMRVLLPERHHIRKVGGRHQKAFWVFGENHNWHWKRSHGKSAVVTGYDKQPFGEWRLELEPADTALDHNFLTVLHPTHRSTRTMPDTELIDAGKLSGVLIESKGQDRVVLFSSAKDGKAPEGVLSYRYETSGETLNLLFDLNPGVRYQLVSQVEDREQRVSLKPDPEGAHVVSSQGVLQFVL